MKIIAITTATLALTCIGWSLGGYLMEKTPASSRASSSKPSVPSSSLSQSGTEKSAEEPMKDTAKEEADSDQAEIERCKKIDIEHLKKIHQGIMAYVKKYGHYPEQLSQLVPEFITADVLQSPRKTLNKSNAYFAVEHADTGIARPSYAFELATSSTVMDALLPRLKRCSALSGETWCRCCAPLLMTKSSM